MVQSICLGHQSDINAKTRDRDKYALLLLNNPWGLRNTSSFIRICLYILIQGF